MTSLSTVEDITEQAAEQLNSASHNGTVIASQQGNTTAPLKKGKQRNDKIEEFKLKASEGDTDAQLFLADHYMEEENEEEACAFYKLAADQGHPLGLLGLAFNKDCDDRDDLESFQLFLKAANLGDPEAQYRVSLFFLQGRDPETENQLSLQCSQGNEVHVNIPKNLEEGFTWMEKAANKEHIVAQYYMGSMYRKGVFVQQSDLKAFRWFQRSAEKGYAPAQFSLGKYYESDLVGKKDKTTAYDWKLKAAHQGYIEVNGDLVCTSYNKNEIISAVDMFGGPY